MSGLDFSDLLGDLTGQAAAFEPRSVPNLSALFEGGEGGLGHSQFNELLLSYGYDRMSQSFFQYLLDGRTEYESGSAFETEEQLREGILRFQKLALLRYGNVKYAFKLLRENELELVVQVHVSRGVAGDDFACRHAPVIPLTPISGADAYYLGYIVDRELRAELKERPNDPELLARVEKRDEIVEVGKRNHEAYLTSDHLDVYVATSMRARHEYVLVHEFVDAIFSDGTLANLNLRWFDPTQAYCTDRIDKGLCEALMLKRAKCTIYLAQESDTFGKDSELACTLAQGKPVIAFVPTGDEEYVANLLRKLAEMYPNKDERDVILEQLEVVDPTLAWKDGEVRGWIEEPGDMDVAAGLKLLTEKVGAHFDRRARILKEDHPLGLQVHLETGVANGVLVARTVQQCAQLVRRIVLGGLEFEIERVGGGDFPCLLLRERITDCIFRVQSGDRVLTNSFWNFYLDDQKEI